MQSPARYGVQIASAASGPVEAAAETLRLLGYAVVPSGLAPDDLAALSARFDAAQAAESRSPRGALREAAGEPDLLRCPLARDPAFLGLAMRPEVLALCGMLLGPGFVLNQQNGVVNPAGCDAYSQSRWHRDLPYLHRVGTSPLALNALFCLDPFTPENGATWVLPASHKEAAFPSPAVLEAQRVQVVAPAGSFLLLDGMVWHAGGRNRTARDRRAVSHVYAIAHLRQQIDLPAMLGEGFSDDPRVRQLLGFDHPQPRSVEEYLRRRVRAPRG